jgi:hypothetical protein
MIYLIITVAYIANVFINRFLYMQVQRISCDYYDDPLTFTMVFFPLVGTVILLLIILAEYDFDDTDLFFNRLIRKFWNLFRIKRYRD